MQKDSSIEFLRQNWLKMIAVGLYLLILLVVGKKVYIASSATFAPSAPVYDISDLDAGTKAVHKGQNFIVTDADLYDFSYNKDTIYIKLVEQK